MVADEPVSALDVSIRSQVLNLMKRLQAEHQMASVVISHDLAVVKYLADRIGVMYLGKIVELGTGDDIYRRAAHPYTEALIKTIPVPDPAVEKAKTDVGIRGELPSPIDPPSGCRFRTRCPLAQDDLRRGRAAAAAVRRQPPGGLPLPAADARAGSERRDGGAVRRRPTSAGPAAGSTSGAGGPASASRQPRARRRCLRRSPPASRSSRPCGPVVTAMQRRSSACAQAMSRGVSPITIVCSRGQELASPAASPARRRAIGGSIVRSSESEPKPPWPCANQCPMTGGLQLDPRHRLEVAGHEREPYVVARAERLEQLRHPVDDRVDRSFGQRLAYSRQHSSCTSARACVDPLGGDAGLQQDTAVRSHRRFDPRPRLSGRSRRGSRRGRSAVPGAARPRAPRCALHERAVDVEQQQHDSGVRLTLRCGVWASEGGAARARGSAGERGVWAE